MKGITFLVFAAMSVSVWGQEYCCEPEVYEVTLGLIGELHRDHFRDDFAETYRLAVDHTKQLRAADVELVHLQDGKVEKYRLLEDFAKKLWWTYDENQCKRHTYVNRTMHRCVPIDSRLIDTGYLGDEQLAYDRWEYERDDDYHKGREIVSYTRGTCIPVESRFRGERINPEDKTTEGETYSGVYGDFRKGIADPGRYFMLPSICEK